MSDCQHLDFLRSCLNPQSEKGHYAGTVACCAASDPIYARPMMPEVNDKADAKALNVLPWPCTRTLKSHTTKQCMIELELHDKGGARLEFKVK